MSFYALEAWAEAHCVYTPTFFSPYLLIFYSIHYLVTAGIFIEGFIRTRELYLVLLSSVGIAGSWWLNYALLWAFRQPVPVPTSCSSYEHTRFCVAPNSSFAECGALPLDACVSCGMPALEPQLMSFLAAALLLFVMQWRAPRTHLASLALLVLVYVLVLYTHLYFGFNSLAQVAVGAAVGLASGIAFHAALAACAYPRFDRVLRWRLVRASGYRDTFCRSFAPIAGDPAPPLAPLDAGDGELRGYEEFTESQRAAAAKRVN